MYKRKTLKDIYLAYPHKCRDVDLESNTVKLPYVKKEEVDCEHKMALTYEEFSIIAEELFDNIIEELKTGQPYKLPSKLGHFQLIKFKGGGTNWKTTHKYGKRKSYKNLESDGYGFKLLWMKQRRQNCYLNRKWLWRVNILRPRWFKLKEDFNNNMAFRNNLNEK